MSQKTIYTCDRCGAETEDEDRMCEVAVSGGFKRVPSYSHSAFDYLRIRQRIELCEDCFRGMGVADPLPAPQAAEPKAVTIEDLIHEIVEVAVANRIGE